MGESIFNFVLTDFNGIPSLPMFIGNYLLDLLSEFFPVLAILSMIVMVYESIVKGGQDWKSSLKSIAPSGVSMVIIVSILNMHTPMKEKVNSDFQGAFEGVNSYTIVEIMNTFLGFGNVFADSLTHKILYGTTDVSNSSKAIMNGYFPTVLKSLLNKKKEEEKKNQDIVKDFKKYTDPLDSILLGTAPELVYKTTSPYKNNNGKVELNADYKNFQYMYDYSALDMLDENFRYNGHNKPLKIETDFWGLPVLANSQGDHDNLETILGEGVKKEYDKIKNTSLDQDGSIDSMLLMEAAIKNYQITDTPPTMFSFGEEKALPLIMKYAKNEDSEKSFTDNLSKHMYKYFVYLNKITSTIEEITAFPKSKDAVEDGARKNFLNSLNEKRQKLLNYLQSGDRLNKFWKIAFAVDRNGELIVDKNILSEIQKVAFEKGIIAAPDNLDNKYTFQKFNENTNNTKYTKRTIDEGVLFITKKTHQTIFEKDFAKYISNKTRVLKNMYLDFESIVNETPALDLSLGYGDGTMGSFIVANPFSASLSNTNFMNDTMKRDKLLKSYQDSSFNEKFEDLLYKRGDAMRGLVETNLIHWTDLGKYYAGFKILFNDAVMNSFNITSVDSIRAETFNELVKLEGALNPESKMDASINLASGAALATAGGVAMLNGWEKLSGVKDMIGGKDKGKGVGFEALWKSIQLIGGIYFAYYFVSMILPAFIWMFIIISYYVEMSMYVAIFPIGFLFMIFTTMRSSSVRSYITMLLGFILLPVTLVSLYFIILYLDILMPIMFKQFMPYFNTAEDLKSSLSVVYGGSNALATDAGKAIFGGNTLNSVFEFVGSIIYTILSLIMSVLLLLTFFKANDFMSKVLQVNTIGTNSEHQANQTMGKLHSLDKSGVTSGILR